MAVLKCKMCGGDLNLIEGASTAECEYCGSVQTIPKVDDEKKLTLFARANRLRAACEFDKAAGIYEAIVADFPEEAEAYWGLVLCTYGIEYVDDPATGKKVPTCHRSGFDSVMKDQNVELAQEYADVMARKLYREEAKAIEELRKGIIAVSANEQPYDLFICYKETDFEGKRTLDSVLAQDIYDALTEKGYRVFFSRITLEDKLGVEYEPYIFAALNSAKIMLVVGADYEYFNAVWVKNEWSRFLKLMAKDKSKHLIPCYKGIDAYDMPEEFARLQAQDLDKMGAVQDIVRGVQKLLPKQEQIVKETVAVQQTVANNPTVASYLKRAFMFLQDGDWSSADEYCEKVLDIDPECAEAYVGKLMAEMRVKSRDGLGTCHQPFGDTRNYGRAIMFGNDKLKKELQTKLQECTVYNQERALQEAYEKAVALMNSATDDEFELYFEAAKQFELLNDYKDSKEKAQLCHEEYENQGCYYLATSLMDAGTIDAYREAIETLNLIAYYKDSADLIVECKAAIEAKLITIYNSACSAMSAAKTEEKYKEAAQEFASLQTYKDAEEKARMCLQKAQDAHMDSIYNSALSAMNKSTIPALEKAIKIFEDIPEWKDSAAKITECECHIEKLKEEETNKQMAAVKAAKKKKITTAVVISAICVVIAFVIVLNTVIIPNNKYNDAIALMEEGEYDKAYDIFAELGNYKDTADKIAVLRLERTKASLKTAKVGDCIKFGTYMQSKDSSGLKEDVEWIVLDIRDGKALVISKYVLDDKVYNENYEKVTWETCSLRQWLNNEFINAAFTHDERELIATVMVPDDSADGGNSTQDQVFILSSTEAKQYFDTDSERICYPTAYAEAKGAWCLTDGSSCNWWLRTTATIKHSYSAYHVDWDGEISGLTVHHDQASVRPAMWVNIDNP